MTLSGGLVGAGLMGFLAIRLMGPATANLGGQRQLLVLAISIGIALLIGFLTGSAICRRAAARRRNLGLFSLLAAGMGGGLIGAAWMVTLLASYLATYGARPQGALDTALTVIAFPALGALGFSVGSLVGSVSGLLAGGVLALALPARR